MTEGERIERLIKMKAGDKEAIGSFWSDNYADLSKIAGVCLRRAFGARIDPAEDPDSFAVEVLMELIEQKRFRNSEKDFFSLYADVCTKKAIDKARSYGGRDYRNDKEKWGKTLSIHDGMDSSEVERTFAETIKSKNPSDRTDFRVDSKALMNDVLEKIRLTIAILTVDNVGGAITDAQKEMLTLRIIEGLRNVEIANIYGIPRQDVDSSISRARKAFLKKVEQIEMDEETRVVIFQLSNAHGCTKRASLRDVGSERL